MEEILDPIVRDVIIGIVLAGGVGLFAYIRRKLNQLDKLCSRIVNLEKTILILTKLIATQTKRAHPDIDTSSLEKMIDIMMKDGD